MNRFSALVAWPVRQFTRFIHAVIGDIAWRPPGWLQGTKAFVARRPWLCGTFAVTLAVCVVAAWWVANWYAHLPKPLDGRLVDQFDSPGYYRQPVTLRFDRSVAALEFIGKDVARQVTLSPKLEGRWMWTNGSELTFYPAADWSAATTYRVHLAKGLFSWHVRIATLDKEFQTAPFTASISDLIFYVNPKDPAVKQVTATLRFSYPVDRASLENNLTLAMESGENVFKDAPNATGRCTFTYDPKEHDCVVYVRSVNVACRRNRVIAILTVPDSVRTSAGGARLASAQEGTVLVPCNSDLFHIASAQTTIVTNPQGDPEQTLIVATSVGVKPASLAKALHAWVLPKPKKRIDAYTEKNIETWDSPAEVDAAVLAQSTPVAAHACAERGGIRDAPLVQAEGAGECLRLCARSTRACNRSAGLRSATNSLHVSQMPPYPRAVQIMHDGSLLALSGERKLSILSRGVEQLEFRLARDHAVVDQSSRQPVGGQFPESGLRSQQ